MRLLYVILLSLCFLALRGYNYTFAKAHQNNNSYSPARKSALTQQALGYSSQTSKVKSGNVEADKKLVIDIEDEDDSSLTARKYILLVRCLSVVFFGLIFRICYFKRRSPASGLLHYTGTGLYLKQGVLRL